jgi:hypothetical protein
MAQVGEGSLNPHSKASQLTAGTAIIRSRQHVDGSNIHWDLYASTIPFLFETAAT